MAGAGVWVVSVCCQGRCPMASIPASVREVIDDHMVKYASGVIATLAAAKKVSPQYLAMDVPGVCHTHAPCRKRKFDCAFCERRGNCFAPPADGDGPTDNEPATSPAKDLVAKHVNHLVALFAEQLRLLRHDIEAVVEQVRGIVAK